MGGRMGPPETRTVPVGAGGVTQYYGVQLSSGAAVAVTAVNNSLFGIAQTTEAYAAAPNTTYVVCATSGESFAVASKAIAAGAKCYLTTTGKITDTTGAAGTTYVGTAQTAAGADGDVFVLNIDRGITNA